MAETKFGTFEELMAGITDTRLKIAHKLKNLIQDVHPETVEVVRLGDRAATYGIGPRKMKEGYCYIMPQKDRINLGFFKGATLNDPSSLLEGTGKALRHIKVHTLEMVDNENIRDLIQQAVAERTATLD